PAGAARPPAAGARASARRPAALGAELRRLAPARAVRRRTAERRGPRAAAFALRRARNAAVGGASRAAARAGVFHRSVEAPLRPRDVARDARPLAGLHLVEPRILREVPTRRDAVGTGPPRRPEGRRRRDARRERVHDAAR